MEAVDGVGEEDGEAVEVVEEAVDAARGDVVASGLTVLLLELADVLARREPVVAVHVLFILYHVGLSSKCSV